MCAIVSRKRLYPIYHLRKLYLILYGSEDQSSLCLLENYDALVGLRLDLLLLNAVAVNLCLHLVAVARFHMVKSAGDGERDQYVRDQAVPSNT